jgi:hypothetical protein
MRNGNVIDPEKVDTGLQFEATKWELMEISCVMVAANNAASIRSLDDHDVVDVRVRMECRQRMHDREQDAMLGRTIQ